MQSCLEFIRSPAFRLPFAGLLIAAGLGQRAVKARVAETDVQEGPPKLPEGYLAPWHVCRTKASQLKRCERGSRPAVQRFCGAQSTLSAPADWNGTRAAPLAEFLFALASSLEKSRRFFGQREDKCICLNADDETIASKLATELWAQPS